MLEKILKILKSEGVIYSYDVEDDNNVMIVIGTFGDVIRYNFKQEDNTFTLKITDSTSHED